jgi:hypothetical protein
VLRCPCGSSFTVLEIRVLAHRHPHRRLRPQRQHADRTLLGQLDGFCAAGEVCFVWERGFAQNQLCGCQVPFRECAFWRAVFDDAFGGFDRVDPAAMAALVPRVKRTRYIPYLALRQPAAYRADYQRFAAALLPLYRAIQRVSGCRWLIDSSKDPSYAFVLAALPEVRLSMVHLVRDAAPSPSPG